MLLRWSERNTRLLGILGPGTIALGTLVSLGRYELGGGDTHPFYYWPVSGLGDHNVAPWPWLFNTCVISGALLMALFLLGVGQHLGRRSAWVAIGIGIVSTLGLAGVGWFPSAPETLDIHYVAAGIAFVAATLLGIFFSVHVLLHAPPHFPKWLAYPGLLSVVCTSGLIAAVSILMSGHNVHALMFNIGGIELSGIILMEWLAFISLHTWVMLTAVGLRPAAARNDT